RRRRRRVRRPWPDRARAPRRGRLGRPPPRSRLGTAFRRALGPLRAGVKAPRTVDVCPTRLHTGHPASAPGGSASVLVGSPGGLLAAVATLLVGDVVGVASARAPGAPP